MSVTDLHSRRAPTVTFHVCSGLTKRYRVVDGCGNTYGEFELAATAQLLRDLLIQGSGDASASRVTTP